MAFRHSQFWSQERIFDIPPALKAALDHGVAYMKTITKVWDAPSDSIYRNDPIASGISVLSLSGCPHTVHRRVVSIVFNALNAPAFLSFAHIFRKVLKKIPSFANLYAATAVIAPPTVVLVSASTQHLPPNFVKSRPSKTASRPLQTSAGFRDSKSEVSPVNDGNVSALATAGYVFGVRPYFVEVFNCRKSSKLFPDDARWLSGHGVVPFSSVVSSDTHRRQPMRVATLNKVETRSKEICR